MPGLIHGAPSSPVAQKTILGWILSGTIFTDNQATTVHAHHCKIDYDLQELISRFWIQEEVPALPSHELTKDEEECERHFRSTHSRKTDGRYVVRLPVKSDAALLGASRARALNSLNKLTKKFIINPEFRHLYREFLQEYQRLGHMVKISTSDLSATPSYYLPHLGVLRENSRTTKLRVVFNASSRTSYGLALNDILHPSAKLQKEIADILLWIRTHRFLFSTDMEKMYRQIAVHKDDWDLQRVLWIEQDGSPTDYQLTTVTYGLNCAPFLALRTIQQLVNDEGHRYPSAVVPLTKGRYVDDIFGGAETISEAKEVIQQLVQLCEAGRFALQKWSSNCPDVLSAVRNKSTSSVEIEPSVYKILGLAWKPDSDTFHFSTAVSSNVSALTKRIISSDIARLYDPLGLIAPVLIRAKVILQALWLTKVG